MEIQVTTTKQTKVSNRWITAETATKEVQKPNIEDFDLQPYGYIHALQIYVEFLESKIYTKENKTEENIYLNRLKEQYKQMLSKKQGDFYLEGYNRLSQDYLAMRLFCLDTQLISFNDIEAMEYEVNQSFS